jgi:hypothetical protein
MSKKFWYLTKKAGNNLQIYYKLMNDNGVTQYFQTQTKRAGNKKVKLIRTLMKNNWPIVTKRLVVINPDLYSLDLKGWKEIDLEEMLSYLRRGNPDDTARSYLFAFFGYNIFSLTNLEREYFKASFSNPQRLAAFYRAIKGECRNRGTGYTYRDFRGRSVLITPGKIKKALMELFKVDPQEILYKKTK